MYYCMYFVWEQELTSLYPPVEGKSVNNKDIM